MRLCPGGPLLVEPTGFLHDGSRLAQQDRVTSEPEDEIDMAPVGEHLKDLWGGEMTVPTDQDMGPWPVAPQISEEPDQDHGILGAERPLSRPEAGGHQGMGSAFKNEQGQIAIAPVMMVIEGEFLLAMRRVIGVIEVKDNGGGGLGVTGNEVVDERLREPVEVFAVHAVLQPGEGRGTGQVLGWLQR